MVQIASRVGSCCLHAPYNHQNKLTGSLRRLLLLLRVVVQDLASRKAAEGPNASSCNAATGKGLATQLKELA